MTTSVGLKAKTYEYLIDDGSEVNCPLEVALYLASRQLNPIHKKGP